MAKRHNSCVNVAMEYFSDIENGKSPQTVTEIPHSFWCALVSKINEDFGDTYRNNNKFQSFMDALGGEVPLSPRPFTTTQRVKEGWDDQIRPYVPERAVVMDIIQFSYKYLDPKIAIEGFTANYEAELYRDYINRLFERNALAFKLLENGNIERLINPVLGDSIERASFNTSDAELDQYLDKAVSKFLHHDIKTRKESLEALWDAFERIKTIAPGAKSISAKTLVDKSSNCQNMRERIEAEANALTKIGNDFMIRHSETNKSPIVEEKHVDYLFHRMFALIWLWLESLKK